MAKGVGSAVGPTFRAGYALPLAASLAVVAALILLGDKAGWHFALAAAVFFFCAALLALMGDIHKRLVYVFIMFQMAVELLGPLSFLVLAFCALMFPALILQSVSLGRVDSIPFRRPLALMLAGWLLSFVYVGLVLESGSIYTSQFNVQFLLGLGTAYMVFYSLRMKYLEAGRLLFYIALSGLPLIALTVARYFSGGYASMIFNGRFGGLVEVNPNAIAMYLSTAFPCALLGALYGTYGIAKKALLYESAALYLIIILMTASRGALLWLFVIAVWILWSKRSVVLLLGALAGGTAAFLAVGGKMLERIFNPTTMDMMSNVGRADLLRAALKALSANYYTFGIGMNTFAMSKSQYGYQGLIDSSNNTGLSYHNAYLEIWMGWGILGIVGWLALNIGVIRALIRRFGGKYAGVSKAAAFALLSFLLTGVVDSSIASFAISFPFFVILGVAFFITARKNETESIAVK